MRIDLARRWFCTSLNSKKISGPLTDQKRSLYVLLETESRLVDFYYPISGNTFTLRRYGAFVNF